jgi:hypothetical protein
METAKLLVVSQFAHSKVRTSKPAEAGSMQANLMGLPHFEHAKMPISARLNSGAE